VGVAKYSHIFWIPIFLANKRVLLVCSHCRKKKEYGLLNKDERPDIPKKLFGFNRIWQFFLGLWMIVGVFLYSGIIMLLGK